MMNKKPEQVNHMSNPIEGFGSMPTWGENYFHSFGFKMVSH